MNPQSPERQLILASSSPYRRDLLARLRIPFTCEAPRADETPRPDEKAAELTLRLALAKAGNIAGKYPAAVVIGCDQVAELDGLIIGKPGSRDRAVAQLMRFSGRKVDFHTAVAVICRDSGLQHTSQVSTGVNYRELTEDEARRYVALDCPVDCAGSIKSEAAGPALLKSIESPDPTALIGLPLIHVAGALRLAGFQLP